MSRESSSVPQGSSNPDGMRSWLWRKGFVNEMVLKSGVKGRGSDRWWERRWWLWWGETGEWTDIINSLCSHVANYIHNVSRPVTDIPGRRCCAVFQSLRSLWFRWRHGRTVFNTSILSLSTSMPAQHTGALARSVSLVNCTVRVVGQH